MSRELRADRLLVHIDGSSLGNPGPGGAGILVTDGDGRVICERSVPLGVVTNNQAEYRAFIEAMRWLVKEHPRGEIEVFTDSQLLYEQMAGRYRLRDSELARLAESARALMARLRVKLTLVGRERNARADLLARRAARGIRRSREKMPVNARRPLSCSRRRMPGTRAGKPFDRGEK